MARNKRKNRIANTLAVCFWLCAWQAASVCIGQKLILVSPLEVCGALLALLPTADFWQTAAFSAGRIIGGFLLALALSYFAAGRSDPASMVGIAAYVTVFLTFGLGFVFAHCFAKEGKLKCALLTNGLFLVLLGILSLIAGDGGTMGDALGVYGTAVLATLIGLLAFGLRRPNAGKRIKKLQRRRSL